MDTIILCGRSALQFYRTPPFARDTVPVLSGQPTAAALRRRDPSAPILGGVTPPYHVLVSSEGKRRPSAVVRPHVWSGNLPPSPFLRVAPGLAVTTPLLTLLTLAPDLSPMRLCLVASEFTGAFAIFQPDPTLQARLDEVQHADRSRMERGCNDALAGWWQTRDAKGVPSDLWMRPPITSRAEMAASLEQMRGAHGAHKLREALACANEGAASPFEVQAGLLLGLPRRRGGHGLGPIVHNRPIELSPGARRLASQRLCFCDLFLQRGERTLDIECHSRLSHADSDQALSDAERALALQHMGIHVLLLTYAQLIDPRATAEAVRTAERALGIAPPPKSERLLAVERALRREVLVDWRTFGLPDTS